MTSPSSVFLMYSVVNLIFSYRVAAANSSDEVLSLPGLKQSLPSRQFSGFLDVDVPLKDDTEANGRVHYWLVESEGDPSSDPVVFWFNGGPPCSAVGGFLTELGPFAVNADLTLALRDWRWSLATTLVFIETPLGVGFSYDAEDRASSYASDDNTTAILNLRSVLAFYDRFPNLRSLDLFLAGESYAGIYVPMLAQAIRRWNEDKSTTPQKRLPLTGVMVGNGAIATGDWYEAGLAVQRVQHFFNHGLFSPALKRMIDDVCGDFIATSLRCDALLEQMHTEIGPLNQYDIRQTCASSLSSRTPFAVRFASQSPLVAAEDPCQAPSDHMTRWLNLPDVQEALHVTAAAAIGHGSWAPCGPSFGHPVTYARLPQDERKTVWPDLLGFFRVLIYNGDQDNCIPYTQDVDWTQATGLIEVNGWRPWLVDHEVGGYIVEYEKNFSFATVKGAGHMVPEYQPRRAFAMLMRFVRGEPLASVLV